MMSHNNFIQYDSYCIILHPCHLIFPPCPILFGVVFTFNALFVGVFSGSWSFNFPGWLPTTSGLSNFYKYGPYYMVIDGHHWKVITASQKDIKFVWVSPPFEKKQSLLMVTSKSAFCDTKKGTTKYNTFYTFLKRVRL